MNVEIVKIIDWLALNKLSLNISKTHFMLSRRRNSNVCLNFDLKIKGIPIEMVDHTKFLGVYIDSCLTWHKHIKYTAGKIARDIGILCKGRNVSLMTLL